ncbi:MAG: hypothetical protein DIU64_002750 [Caldicoprobacter oshimai]
MYTKVVGESAVKQAVSGGCVGYSISVFDVVHRWRNSCCISADK